MSRRYPCKRLRALELLNDVDRDKTRLGQQEQDMNKQSNDTKDLFPKFTPTKDATSPLRNLQGVGLPYNPFPHPIHHLGGLSSH